MLLKENDVAKANNTVRSEEISSEIWFIALSYPSLSSLLGRAVRRGVLANLSVREASACRSFPDRFWAGHRETRFALELCSRQAAACNTQ